MQLPPRWTPEQLTRQLQISIDNFRRERMEEPLEAYLELFEIYQGRVEELLEATVDLTRLDAVSADVLSDPNLLEVIRYLSGPPISADDLRVLTEAPSLAGRRFGNDPELVERVVHVVMVGLDRRRFPWVEEAREPDESERAAAVVATAALMAVQRLGTARRSEGKSLQEQKVEHALLACGFTKVATRHIRTAADFPRAGEFCGESHLGERKADFVVRLWDNRLLPVECKVSNSATNSVKRLNNDAAVKAKVWRDDFGRTQVVPAAVLSGVYKLRNLEDAQERGLALFWAHDLIEMMRWIESTRTT